MLNYELLQRAEVSIPCVVGFGEPFYRSNRFLAASLKYHIPVNVADVWGVEMLCVELFSFVYGEKGAKSRFQMMSFSYWNWAWLVQGIAVVVV